MPTQAPTAFDWKGFWDMAAHVGTLIGLGAAGVWGYFNFVKSRTYYPRLEMTVSGARLKGTQQYLVPRVTLKNIGRSRVELIQSGSGYRIWTARGEADVTGELTWFGGKPVFDLFLHHKWIEPAKPFLTNLTYLSSRVVVSLRRSSLDW